mmetsp:Transcript_59376/g.132231  ORF Transcript_59376/g.132231 Transcript_59376/m.132231 type:complete len:201 (-) Transcript_59376:442-1044(-)
MAVRSPPRLSRQSCYRAQLLAERRRLRPIETGQPALWRSRASVCVYVPGVYTPSQPNRDVPLRLFATGGGRRGVGAVDGRRGVTCHGSLDALDGAVGYEAARCKLLLQPLLVLLVRRMPDLDGARRAVAPFVDDPQLISHHLDEPLVMRDKDDPAIEVVERHRQRLDCLEVEVVGGLVEQQNVRRAPRQLSKGEARLLAT